MIFDIVGGTYREICLEPNWDRDFGSGMRSAIAVVSILERTVGWKVRLHTCLCDEEKESALAVAASFGVEVDVHQRIESIEFQYAHGLSLPIVFPQDSYITPVSVGPLTLENCLLYGMVECERTKGKCEISAKALVYDPQGNGHSIPFSKTGSNTERLAIVANVGEAKAMARALEFHGDFDSIEEIGKFLLNKESAEVVVVKNGAKGASVFTENDVHHISSYKTQKIFKIGSGDIFSSVFSAYFLGLGADPIDAANRASAAAAYYCQNGGLAGIPIPFNPDVVTSEITKHHLPTNPPLSRVYLAGPFFNFREHWFVEEALRCLTDQGVEVFSPFHEVGRAKSFNLKQARNIASRDLDGLVSCKVVFAILDGLDPGTIFEIGYAVAKKIPVIAFSETVSQKDLLMIYGTNCRVHNDFPTAVYDAAWTALET